MTDYRRGFDDLTREIHEPKLPVDGDWPDWLSGTLIRNGPAQFSVGDQDYRHWFDGHAMLHAFRMANGTVSYRNRFLETQSRTEALAEGGWRRAKSCGRSSPPIPAGPSSDG